MPLIPVATAQSLTVSSTAVTLTVPGAAKFAKVQVQDQDVRFWRDGTTPTATSGERRPAGAQFWLTSKHELDNFKAIREDSTDSILAVSYYTGEPGPEGLPTVDSVVIDQVTAANASIGAGALSANLKLGYINLHLGTARIILTNEIQNTTEAGVPDNNTAGPKIQRVNAATDKMVRIAWAATEVNELQFDTFGYPPDLDDTVAVTFNALMAMAGATDVPTVAVSYWENTGDANAGGNTGAVTGTAITKYTVTIAAGDIGAYPKAAAITLIPAAHGTDVLYLYAAWIEYTRKS